MSSIHEALSRDIHRNSGFPKPNQVVLKSHQERLDGPIGGDFFARKALEHEQARAMRRAEGGRGGGYNDRQEVMHDNRSTLSESVEEGLDDFGRRRTKAAGLSRAARAEAALQRNGGARGSARGRQALAADGPHPARQRGQGGAAARTGAGRSCKLTQRTGEEMLEAAVVRAHLPAQGALARGGPDGAGGPVAGGCTRAETRGHSFGSA
eukprot:CAMPEP_0175531452 /NCGR_PEP_ID=MMETSP0096-20121207/22172_1 /TAXON_ID=311494 /ORGANISM="Alexandrium monilatum, Strain CCMP3105" /LENGTH=208 /DNA_ID=CAMNT_0016834181 /DNA_START=47 /DNA_END=671 /DNA_ORIENTATION=-